MSFGPDMLIYLTEPRGGLSTYRDYLFFWWCGIRQSVGLSKLRLRPMVNGDLLERESDRLGRQLAPLGAIDFRSSKVWDLHLSSDEMLEAARLLKDRFSASQIEQRRLIGFSVGTKQPINDWGDDNWRVVLEAVGSLGFGLVIVGGAEDRQRSEQLAVGWPAPVLNLCGSVSPRLSAAILGQVRVLLCHDSGPMHLAAAVGTPCVTVFSRRNPPGKWFPYGDGNRVLYPTAKSGSIASIRPRQAITAAVDAIGASATRLSAKYSSQVV